MRVKDIMSSPLLTIDPRVSLGEAVRIMKERKISRLVVVEGEKLVGVLTEKDIARIEIPRKGTLGPIQVGDIMTKNPITVDPNVTAKRAAEIMLERNIGCLPVVEGSKGIGIITKLDFAKVCLDFDDVFVGEVMQSGPRTVGLAEKLPQCRKTMVEEDLVVLPVMERENLVGNIVLIDIVEKTVQIEADRVRTMTAGEVMSPPKVARTDWTLAEAARLMLAERISGLPVVNPAEELVGLLTKTELAEVARERL
ncbi:MAG: CBS domain-containing protein [Candidatus Hadarchaeales archaeon]